MRSEAESYQIAAQLRSRIVELFDGGPEERIILCPGILIGLQALFGNLGVRTIALGAEEYYGRMHFPQFDTESLAVDELIGRLRSWKPDAVILSVVTWRGRVIPLADIFRELRKTLKGDAPLLVADYSHGGAAGFPDIGGLNADIVCGDPLKWIARPEEKTRLAFLRIENGPLLEKARRAFQPFFLANADHEDQLFARWTDPEVIRHGVGKLSEPGLDRGALLLRHNENLSLTAELARLLGISEEVRSSILWLDEERPLPEWIGRCGLVWKPPGGGVRILCRADIKSEVW